MSWLTAQELQRMLVAERISHDRTRIEVVKAQHRVHELEEEHEALRNFAAHLAKSTG